MDFSKTKVYQRTRSCFDKLYLEFNQKKYNGRLRKGGGGLINDNGGNRVKDRVEVISRGEGFGKSNDDLRGSNARRGEISAGSHKIRKGHTGREDLGRVSKRGKNIRGVDLIDESEDNDDDDARLNESLWGNYSEFGIDETSGGGNAEKILQKGKSIQKGKSVDENSLIDEFDDDCGSDYYDQLASSTSSGRNQSKFDGHGVTGSEKSKNKFENEFAVSSKACMGEPKGLEENLNHKSARTNDSQPNSDDGDTLSYLGGNAKLSKSFGRNNGGSEYDHSSGKIEKKLEKGFVNNTTTSNGDCLKGKRGIGGKLDKDTSMSTCGCPFDESEANEMIACLGDDVMCMDDHDPSHSSRVGSNEVKVSPAELDSIQADDDDSLVIKLSEEDDNDPQKLESSERDDDPQKLESSKNDDSVWQELEPCENAEDIVVISSRSSSDVEDGDDDSSVLEVENNGVSTDGFWIEVVKKCPSYEDHGQKNEYCEGKYFLKGKPVDEPRKKNEKVEGGSKKRRMDTDTLLGCGRKANERWKDPATCQQHGGGEKTFEQIVTQKPGKSTGRKHIKFGKEIDVIRILTDTIREEENGDNLLRKYVSPIEDSPPKETPAGQVLLYKFRFEDKDSKPEKLESEMEIDGLFNEMNMCLQASEIGSSGAHVVDRSKADFLAEETDQAVSCCQGKHQLTLNDQFGIICRCCPYVEMEIREILPPLSKNGRGGHGRHDIDKPDNMKVSDLRWADSHHEFIHDSKKSNYEIGTVWDLVPGVKETMYPHQREGFEFIWDKIAGGTYIDKLEKRLPNGGSGCIISHAPGTGKSRLTIVFLQAFMRMYPNARPLIIAPRSMLLTWEEEFKKWNVDVPFHILNNNECSGKEDAMAATLLKQAGNEKSLRGLRLLKLYSWKKKPSVLGITYRLFESLAGEEGKRKRTVNNPEIEEMKKILLQVPTLLVLDEGHTPRNDQSLVWKALLLVKTKRSIILSGTPFQNNFDELYNTLCLVNPLLSFGISSIKKHGWKNNAARGQWDSITSSIRKSQHKIHELRAMIDPFVHVHKGTILQERLPGLRDALVVLKPTKTQQTLLGKMKGTKCTLENDHLMSLVSVHPSLLPKNSSDNQGFRKVLKMFEKDPRAGVKTSFLMELIKLSGALNEKVLVFSQYIKPLEFIMELLKSNFKWVEGRECLYMDGQQEEKQRQTSINTLNDPKSEAKVLLASLRACSEGINLVGASRVVLLDVHWNPSVERQAISRAYRLGQKKLVHVYHLVTGTMEGEKYIRQVEKSHLSELIFSSKNKDGSNPKISSTVSADKILEEMVQHHKLQDMFEKVIYHSKESDLIHTFG